MVKHQTKEYPVDDSLHPQNALPRVLKKHDIVQWEIALKQALLAWMQDTNSPFSSVREDLQSPVVHQYLSFQDRLSNSRMADLDIAGTKADTRPRDLHTQAARLLSDLHCHGSLPAILFNYDRKYCEKIIFFVEEQLSTAEGAWKASNPGWREKLAEYEKWKKASSKIDSRKVKSASSQEAVSKKEAMKEAANKETSSWESFDPEAPLDMFSFADQTKLLKSELEDTIASLKDVNLRPGIIEALRRGMGVHHAGMNRDYRQV
jgi:superfamily II RNA helicase